MTAAISPQMRDVLVAHLDGAVVRIPDPDECSGHKANIAQALRSTTMALVDRGFLTKASRPRHTVITETGRFELAKLLAEYAEVLLRAARHAELFRYVTIAPPDLPAAQPRSVELATKES